MHEGGKKATSIGSIYTGGSLRKLYNREYGSYRMSLFRKAGLARGVEDGPSFSGAGMVGSCKSVRSLCKIFIFRSFTEGTLIGTADSVVLINGVVFSCTFAVYNLGLQTP